MPKFKLNLLVRQWGDFDLSQRAEAMKTAAQIINDTLTPTLKTEYTTWLTERLLILQKASGREREEQRITIERLINRELDEDEKRYGASQRLKESRSFKQEEKNSEAKQPLITLTSTPKREERDSQPEPKKADKNANFVTQSVMQLRNGATPVGVVKAEKSLICALLAHPVWRDHILEKLPLEKWTNEIHAEIVIAARKIEAGEEISPAPFCENLSSEAAQLVGEVMLADDAANLPSAEVVNDWIYRVEWYWARQAEKEMLELISGKITRGETVSDAERAAYTAALVATKRKMPVPEKD